MTAQLPRLVILCSEDAAWHCLNNSAQIQAQLPQYLNRSAAHVPEMLIQGDHDRTAQWMLTMMITAVMHINNANKAISPFTHISEVKLLEGRTQPEIVLLMWPALSCL